MNANYEGLPEHYLECFEALNRVSAKTAIKYTLVGATARDLIMEYVHGIQSPRMTYDIDIGIYVGSWGAFEQFKSGLEASGFIANPQVAHSLTYSSASKEPLRLDLLPFGDVSDKHGQISWPPDGNTTMSVVGFAEAFDSATIHSVNGIDIPVITIEALCLLKLVAWADRPRSKKQKDAQDIHFLLSNYLKVGNNQNLIYDEGFAEQYDFDQDLAIAAKLGADVRKICSTSTVEFLELKLFSEQQEASLEELARDMGGLAETNLKWLTAFMTKLCAR